MNILSDNEVYEVHYCDRMYIALHCCLRINESLFSPSCLFVTYLMINLRREHTHRAQLHSNVTRAKKKTKLVKKHPSKDEKRNYPLILTITNFFVLLNQNSFFLLWMQFLRDSILSNSNLHLFLFMSISQAAHPCLMNMASS